jgi:hypothetical protein
MDLDAAIREAAARMGKNLPGGTKVALVSVASSSAQFSEYVISRLEAALVDGGKLGVVDRANLDKIREEQGFQLSGEVDDNSAKSIGKLLGAGAIVTGGFADLGDVYSLTLKAINIETATVAVSYPADLAKSTRIETLLASGGGAGTGTRTAQTGGRSAPAAPAYNIGDTGPAGGIVFYDKGNNSGGWRYLEAASSDAGSVSWATGYDVDGTKVEIGSGKQNTQIIINYMMEAGNNAPAAQVCKQYRQGGYSDWFLPSKAELNLMYWNLKQQELGDFGNGKYWSSSDNTGDGLWASAWAQRFSDGYQEGSMVHNKGNAYSVRAIRQF